MFHFPPLLPYLKNKRRVHPFCRLLWGITKENVVWLCRPRAEYEARSEHLNCWFQPFGCRELRFPFLYHTSHVSSEGTDWSPRCVGQDSTTVRRAERSYSCKYTRAFLDHRPQFPATWLTPVKRTPVLQLNRLIWLEHTMRICFPYL